MSSQVSGIRFQGSEEVSGGFAAALFADTWLVIPDTCLLDCHGQGGAGFQPAGEQDAPPTFQLAAAKPPVTSSDP
jgi:hypothetical protein